MEEPKLEQRSADERIPHVFGPDEPCLYRSDYTSDLPLATTIVPWLLLWLAFYESYLVTGEWQGGGVHPGQASEPDELPEEHF